MLFAFVDVNGYGLAALIVLAVLVVAVLSIGARLLRPVRFRIARLGVFIERRRFEDDPDGDDAETREWPKHDPPLGR